MAVDFICALVIGELRNATPRDFLRNEIKIGFRASDVIYALLLQKNKKIFTGKNKTPLHGYCDYIFQVNSNRTDLIQEAHIFYYHSICDLFENIE